MAYQVNDPLAVVADLQGQRGGPFVEPIVAAECAAIRQICGWHIAPTVQLDLRLDSRGSTVLQLPTLKLQGSPRLYDVRRDVEITGFHVSDKGMVELASGWPRGFGAVRAVFDSGFAVCPPDLLKIIAQRCVLRQVVQESVGPFSQTFAANAENATAADILAGYMLGHRP